MLEALEHDGQPVEAGWPYLAQVSASGAGWAPPAITSEYFKRRGSSAAPDWSRLIGLLDHGLLVVLLLTLSKGFFGPVQGVVQVANDEQPDPALRHAVLAVGHGYVDDAPAILVRNSWGLSWGEAGHAWLSHDFIVRRLFGMALLEEDEDVHRRSVAA